MIMNKKALQECNVIDCFVSNLTDLSQFLSISNSAEKLDDVTETMDSLFSSPLDTVSPLCSKED